MALWEYNIYVSTFVDKQKHDVANAILTGYYAGYYVNGGKGIKKPDRLIKELYAKKQDLQQGLAEIEKVKELERRNIDNGNQLQRNPKII